MAAELPALPALEPGARALVVEDLDYNARTLGAMLGKLGFTVDYAREGADALRMIATQPYRVVFLDYDLPDMSGLDVARKVRARESGPARPLLIATTAYAAIDDRNACMEAGMDAFLGKPITPDKLRTTLSQVPATALPAQPMNLPAETNRIINLQMLTYLAGDTPGGLQREIKRFLEALLASHQAVIDALLTRNRPLLGRAAHHLLSHARMVEAADLAALAEELEFNADFLDETSLDQLCARVSTAVEQIKEILIRHLPEQTPA